MFDGFNEATLQYLQAVADCNCRETFHENAELFARGIREPLDELYDELSDYFYRIDSGLVTVKRRCISSPYNDARFCRSNPMKEYFYIRYKAARPGRDNVVGFYFDASVTNYKYGLNIYNLNARGMQLIREKILSEKSRAKRVINDFYSKKPMELAGERYKREYYPQEEAVLRKWLELRTMTFYHREEMNPGFFERRLYDDMVGAYGGMKEVYFFIKEALAPQRIFS